MGRGGSRYCVRLPTPSHAASAQWGLQNCINTPAERYWGPSFPRQEQLTHRRVRKSGVHDAALRSPEPMTRLELVTYGLRNHCSTD